MTIAEMIKNLEKSHVSITDIQKTCDGVICGDTDRECKGIAVTCCSTAAVIKKAADLECNLLITHEPTFYHGYDRTEEIQSTPILEAKTQLIRDTGMVIYRDHDRVHREVPDMVYAGIVKSLGWESYASDKEMFPISGYQIPETTLGKLGRLLGEKLGIDGMRMVGDPDMKVRKVGLTAHFLGGAEDQQCIRRIEEGEYDVVIPLETVDWTIVEYIMDCNVLGKQKGLLLPGHFNLEEAGMQVIAQWIRNIAGVAAPVKFISSGNMYRWADSRITA